MVELLQKKVQSRRTFMAGLGTAAALAAAGCADNGTLPVTTAAITDNDILNFALNLEYLEAEFYLRAATGAGLSSSDTGSGAGTVTIASSSKVPGLTSAQQNIVNELAYTEQQHVRALRSALGSAAVARPNLDYNAGFGGGVTAANTLSNSYPTIPTSFSPFTNFDSFIVGALLFEDVGVTAYSGAAGLISSAGIASGILETAGGILAVEAYHAGLGRSYLTGQAIAQGSTNYMYAGYFNRLTALRAALGGGNETPLTGFSTSPVTVANVTASSVVAADSNALGYARTTDQVLHIVYGTFSTTSGSTTPSAGVSSGGFFPNGLNGTIKTTQS